jgi:predicted  nucleic acid-binding Zn-ribbon protein
MGIESAENWFINCDGFLEELENAQDEYNKNTEEVAKDTEENFGDIETAISNTTEESKKLQETITELAPKLKDTLKKAIDEATLSWLK